MATCHNMRKGYGWIGLLLLGILAWGAMPAAAQEALPEFEVDAVGKRSAAITTQTQLDLYTKIPYSRLSFINTPNGFQAHYTVTVEAIELDDQNRRQNLVQTRLWESQVQADIYAVTQADDRFDFTTQTLDLEPGRYMLEMEVADQNSSQVFVREMPVDVRNLNKRVAVSDITLVDAFDAEAYTILPNVANRIGTDELGLKIFYETYTDQPQSVVITHEVVLVQKDVGLAVAMHPDDVAGGEFVYTQDKPLRLEAQKNQHVIDIPIEDLRVGTYLVQVKIADEAGNLLDVAQRGFMARWTGLDQHIQDIDEAIAQLEYIAKRRDLNFIREGQTEQERYSRFKAFWQKRDPTPRTRRNERMEEYYYRVAAANRQYGTLREGWRTDRGYVLVNFGEPDDIERYPYSFGGNTNKPYEIWYYYRIGRRFIFIDKTGLGDYELHVPVWDERTRIH